MTRRRLISLFFVLAVLFSAAANSVWEEVPTSQAALERVEAEGIDINTRNGYIYITTSRPATVKIFSILGQLISQENIPAGTHRLHLDSRGIYILKVGSITRRITI